MTDPVVLDAPPPDDRGARLPGANTRNIDWVAIMARLRKDVGKAMLFPELTDYPNAKSVYQQVKNKPPAALYLPGYTVVANIRRSHLDGETGRRVGDVWLTLVKEGKK